MFYYSYLCSIHTGLQNFSPQVFWSVWSWGSCPWHTELHKASDECTFLVKAFLQQEFRALSSAQTCQFLKSVLHWALASHQMGFSWSRAFVTPCCKGGPSHTAVHTAQLLQQGATALWELPAPPRGNAWKSALFDAALEGIISGFTALVLHKT